MGRDLQHKAWASRAKSKRKILRLGSLHPKNEQCILGDPASPAPDPSSATAALDGPRKRAGPSSTQDAWEFECPEEEVLVRPFVTSQLAFVSFLFALRSMEGQLVELVGQGWQGAPDLQ